MKIVREKYLSEIPGPEDRLQMHKFLSKLYIFLVDKMHDGLKKVQHWVTSMLSTHAHTRIHIHNAHTHIHIRARTHIHIRACTHIHICAHTHTHTHTHTQGQTPSGFSFTYLKVVFSY